VKRKVSIFLLVTVLAFAAAFICQRDGSVEIGSFQAQFRDALQLRGFTILAQASGNRDQVPLPLTIRWHPRHWHINSSTQAIIGFPDSSDHFTVSRDGTSLIECFVRYLDSRAQLIDIRAAQSQGLTAADVQLALRKQFPGLPINLRIQ